MPESDPHPDRDQRAESDEVATGERSKRRARRRVTTPPPEGSDPHPAPEPPRGDGSENDDRMRGDRPPHY